MIQDYKTIAVEVQWDGVPPNPDHLRKIARLLMSIDRDAFCREHGGDLTEEDLTERGVRFEWHKVRMTPSDFARRLGAEHPVKVRYAVITWYTESVDADEDLDPWVLLDSAPWIHSQDLKMIGP